MFRLSLQSSSEASSLNEKIDSFINTNVNNGQQDTPSPDIIWDTFKAYMRGMIISFSSKKKNDLDSQIKDKEREIKTLESCHKKKNWGTNWPKQNKSMNFYFQKEPITIDLIQIKHFI